MNRKEVERLLSEARSMRRKQLLADESFMSFMRHFPASITEAVKKYFRLEATGIYNYIICLDKNDREKAICTRCGAAIKASPSWCHKDVGQCPACGHQAEVIHSWRRWRDIEEKFYFVYYERAKYAPGAIIARGIVVYRSIEPATGSVCEQYIPVDYYYISKTESARYKYTYPGNLLYADFTKVNAFTNVKNKYLMAGYIVNDGWDTLEQVLPQSDFKYSQIIAYLKSNSIFGRNPETNAPVKDLEYLELYRKYPWLEMLIKNGLGRVINDYLNNDRSYSPFPEVINWRGKNMSSILRMSLSKAERKALREVNITANGLQVLQWYKKQCPKRLVTDILAHFVYLENNYYECLRFLEEIIGAGLDAVQIVGYLSEQDKKSKASVLLRDYADYLGQCRHLGLNLLDTAVARPADFLRAHDNLSAQIRIEKNKELDRLIAQGMEDRQSYFYQYAGLACHPAKDAEELIQEGKALNHCVGTYAKNYATGHCHIVLIRRLAEPERPYYTMEITPEGIIAQVRGDHNKGKTYDVAEFIEHFEQDVLEKNRKRRKSA